MNQEKPALLTVGQLAQKSGVTIRTLQYYDRNGLLKPSSYSEGGRRLYDRQDSLKLQQILFLKSLGFTLEAIRDKLLPTRSAADLMQMLRGQKRILIDQKKQLQEGIKLIDQVIVEIGEGDRVELDRIFAVVGAMQQSNPYAFMVRHMDRAELVHYSEKAGDAQRQKRLNESLQDMSQELLSLKANNILPQAAAFQNLARRWWDIILQLTDGDPEKIQNLFQRGDDDSLWPESTTKLRLAMDTLGQALCIYFEKEGIPLPIQEEE